MYWISLDATLKLPLIFRVTGYPISLFDLRFLWVPGVYFVSILATVFFFFPPFFFLPAPSKSSVRKKREKEKKKPPSRDQRKKGKRKEKPPSRETEEKGKLPSSEKRKRGEKKGKKTQLLRCVFPSWSGARRSKMSFCEEVRVGVQAAAATAAKTSKC